jgi:hypothetical protein
LQDDATQEKVIRNKLADFTFIYNGWLEKMRVRDGHHKGERSQQHRIGARAKEDITRNDGGGRSD